MTSRTQLKQFQKEYILYQKAKSKYQKNHFSHKLNLYFCTS